jgi:hypothetical protein
MAKKQPATDPRFDPRFQRGYSGPEPEPLPTLRAENPMSWTTPVDPTDPAAEGHGSPDPARSGSASTSDVAADDAYWPPPRRNPFALALLIGGVVMIAVGGWLIWSVVTASSYPNGYDEGEQAFALIQQQLTPALLICGVLGIAGWLVLGALAASDRKGE